MIKLFVVKVLSIKIIKIKLDGVHGEPALLYITVANWIAEFKCDRSSVENVPLSGMPKPMRKLLQKFTKS